MRLLSRIWENTTDISLAAFRLVYVVVRPDLEVTAKVTLLLYSGW